MSNAPLPSSDEMIARLDRLPVWPYRWSLLIIIGLGFFFGFFDITSIGIALPVFAKQFGVSASQAAWTITSSLIGYVIGSFIDSRLSDLFGRKLALLISVSLFSVGSLLSATSQNLTQLIVWRFVIGMGIGAEIAGVVTYIGELAPARLRGKISAMCVACAMIGFAVVPFVGGFLVPNFSWGWRLMFVIGGLGAIITLVMRWFMPESLRWLLARDRHQQAYATLLKIEQTVSARIGQLPELALGNVKSVRSLPSCVVVLRVMLFASIWFCYYIGNYAWLTLDTQLFTRVGFDLSNSLLLVSLTSFGFVVGSVTAIVCGDRLERKWVCVAANCVWVCALLVIGWWHSFSVILLFGFIAATCIGFSIPMMYIFTAEQFPTTMRATCVSITDGIGHIGGAICGQYTFAFYHWFKPSGYGFTAAFSAMALTGALTMILLMLTERHTKQALQQ